MRWPVLAFAAMAACRATPPEASDEEFLVRVREISRVYHDFGQVDDRPRAAPGECKAIGGPYARQSASEDVETHGRKFYLMYARDRGAYRSAPASQPVGQAIVKAAWHESRRYDALYVMFKVDASAAGTDAGWVYATVGQDGAVSAGRLKSCMRCHRSQPDRVFGLPND